MRYYDITDNDCDEQHDLECRLEAGEARYDEIRDDGLFISTQEEAQDYLNAHGMLFYRFIPSKFHKDLIIKNP